MKLIQFETLFMRDFKTTRWPFPLHNHNHYELMLIREGSGTHILNGKSTAYQRNSLFFMKPEDEHDFMIEQETHFNVIKFLPGILKGGLNTNNTDFWDNLLMSMTRTVQSAGHKDVDSKALHRITVIAETLIADWRDHDEKVTELHTNLLRSLLLMIEKTYRAAPDLDLAAFGNSPIDRVQNYIHTYIRYPEKTSVKELSTTFNMSEAVFKVFFKREMGMTLREYISSLKMQQIKQNLKLSSRSISEIARDFGFTDSSHFYRFFLNHTGVTPNKYRKGEG